MKLWTVEPRSTLVVRDARPVLEGSPPMRSLDFPWPSSIAGMVRTRIGLDERGHFTLSVDEARAIAVAGPLLVNLDREELAVPAPRDCVWFRDGRSELPRDRLRLRPAPLADGVRTDLASGLDHLALPDSKPEKPTSGPSFWRWSELEAWLRAPEDTTRVREGTFGLKGLTHERRVHVAISEDLTAEEGKLFESDGLRFVIKDEERHTIERLALTFLCDDARLATKTGVVRLGGEARMSILAPAALTLPKPPEGLREDITEARRARVVLLTPALFSDGFRPGGASPSFGPGVEVTAAAVGRPEIISGWDFHARGPKPVRRAAPAGSVYWVSFDEGVDIAAWLDETWLRTVSDELQDRRDGFGLAVVGVA